MQELPLLQGQVITAGRAETCDLVLQPESGISRQHFKIFEDAGLWKVEVLAKYGAVQEAGQNVRELQVSHGSIFNLTPYEFEVKNAEEASHLPAVSNHQVVETEQDLNDFDEATSVGQVRGVPYIKIIKDQSGTSNLIRLEGISWIAGRDSTCSILIDDPRISRQQFEISQTSQGFYILDLGSANGTLVNNNPISTSEPQPIRSGDKISILDYSLYFEIRDPEYETKLALINSNQLLDPYIATERPIVLHSETAIRSMSTNDLSPQTVTSRSDWRSNKVAIFSIVLLIAGVIFYVIDEGNKDQKKRAEAANVAAAQSQDPFLKLSIEKQSLVKHSYNLAKNLFMQGKYELAASEIAKVHEFVPEYEDSREIEEQCRTAFEINRQKALIEKQEADAREQESKVRSVVKTCTQQMNKNTSMENLETCLQPALELNPDHELISALKAKLEQQIENQQIREAQREAYNDKLRQTANLFKRAERIRKSGDPKKAISAYQALIKTSLPDPKGYKKIASRRIASIQGNLNQKVNHYLEESKRHYEGKNLKEAIASLENALAIDEGNEKTQNELEKIKKEINKQMRAIYQESVIEESLGNVESAKEKWRKIIEQNTVTDEYHKKATMKLKKYGGL